MPFKKGLTANKNENFLDKGNLSNLLKKAKIIEIGRVRDIILKIIKNEFKKHL